MRTILAIVGIAAAVCSAQDHLFQRELDSLDVVERQIMLEKKSVSACRDALGKDQKFLIRQALTVYYEKVLEDNIQNQCIVKMGMQLIETGPTVSGINCASHKKQLKDIMNALEEY